MIWLSILIPTVTDRFELFRPLFVKLNKEAALAHSLFGVEIEVRAMSDDKTMTIGEKRNKLYADAKGLYSWQIDDDDDISEDALKAIILKFTMPPVDCITFQERCLMNGMTFKSNHSLKYDDWGEHQDGFDYVRTPYMKSVIKTEIARSVPIPHIRFGEDHEWAKALKPHLNAEIHIDKELYIYQHNSKPEDFESRYGIKQTNI